MSSLAAMIVHVALQAAPAPACEVTDNACKAREFIEKARTATPGQRANFLFTAHKSYLALFAQTGKARDLCAARASFDRSVGVKGQSDSQRARFEGARAELEALEQRHGARCGASARRQKRVEPTPIALTGAVPTDASPPEPPTVVAAPSSQGVDRTAELVAIPAPTSLRAAMLDGPRDMPAPAEAPRSRGRSMVIAGGTTLGVGLVLVGVGGYAGSQLSAVLRASHDVYENAHGQGKIDALGDQERLQGEYRRWLPLTLTTAIAGTSAVVVGAVLVSLGVRRWKTGPSQTALIPAPGGLAIHARF